ncbi:MAG: sodium:solute symporter family protein [Saprospiraceae bacterium]|nr:sodium:solute symporter family protein [Saprospiraceae bacterium]
MVYVILILYIALTFLTSLRGTRALNRTPEGYFLAGRNLGTLALFFTIIATNFSAFYFLGFAGEGYRVGFPYYVVMAFGTAFACLSFFFIGEKAWHLGKTHGYITPSELVYGQTGSRPLRWLFAVIMIVFTFPYLALQLIGAGYLLENMTGGEIPYFLGAAILTLFTIGYVLLGGMRSVASTDLKQGLLMMLLMLAAVIWIAHALGGFTSAQQQVFERLPDLFRRTGVDGTYTPQKWFSLLIFWLFCIPMFPQIFMRFFVGRGPSQLRKSAVLYATIPLIISIFPVLIGLMGHVTFPELTGREADQILPMMLVEHCPEWFAALVMTGALAAFMSTLDSQLLALSTIVTRDLVLPFRPGTSMRGQVRIGRIFVVLFALVGLIIAWQPFDTIFDMGKLAFSGLAVLFPPTLAILYYHKIPKSASIVCVILGETLLLLFYYNVLPASWLLGFEPAIVILALEGLILAAPVIWQRLGAIRSRGHRRPGS